MTAGSHEASGSSVLRCYRTSWGTWDYAPDSAGAFVADSLARGYDGVDVHPLLAADALPRGTAVLCRAPTFGRTVHEHLDWVRRCALAAQALGSPWLILQGGRDSWGDEDVGVFLAGSLDIEQSVGLPIAHETHRQRVLFTPWAAARALDRFPSLHLALDLSHWVVVAERLLDHEGHILERCWPRTLHIDARVGHEEAPQVDDPSDPRWARHLAAHERWWSSAAAAGRSLLTVVPEHGPEPYRPKGAPPSDQANDWLLHRVRALPTSRA